MATYNNNKTTPYYGRHIFDRWEKGEPQEDSTTASVCSVHYRQYILEIVKSVLNNDDVIISIGAGNGFTEKLLSESGFRIYCFDIDEYAVKLCKEKGLNACCADFFSLSSISFPSPSLIYMDGVLGHLFTNKKGLQPFFSHIRSIMNGESYFLLFSFDDILKAHCEPHIDVKGYFHLSSKLVHCFLKKNGFTKNCDYIFEYYRPISGMRKRRIILSRRES